ncbi:plasmalemma vesicle associated protein b [Girardinichthys multiradiatus]|uniref:plasmalemma vesicle associated protein b n=1 Tax=Girardinichthys multiradiatus TaxID=208333 RepID=UPI001FABCE90|nr:plasmalemma vesicle associated protein b [Girardinichthys multiradiatus]
MYSSSYSRARLSPESRQPLYRNKGKSCGYYMRIVFFFSSLIQSLIIVSLVLFLIYGQPEKSAEEKQVEELEQVFNKLSKNNIDLRKEKGELGDQLAARTAEKAGLEKEMAKQKTEANNTEHELKKKIANLERSMSMMRRPPPPPPFQPPPPPVTFNNEANILKSIISQKDTLIGLINSNFTQMVQYLTHERDSALRDQDVNREEAIKLGRENNLLKEQLTTYTRKCKEDFAQSLDGIQAVTTKFLSKIENLFPHSSTFHLTCNSQEEQLEKIKSSCTNLSRDVESKFQMYLDNVGNKVVEIQDLSSKLEVHNAYLTSRLQQCGQKHSTAVTKAANDLQHKQKVHDDQVEKLLMEQRQLREQNKLQEDRLVLKDKEIQVLQGMVANKAGPPNAASPHSVPQQGRQAAASWALGGTTGISKPPMVG